MTITLTAHVLDRIADRPLISYADLCKAVDNIEQWIGKYAKCRQVAVVLREYDHCVNLGNTYGDRLVLVVDVEQGTVPTIFCRNKVQRKPQSVQAYVNMYGYPVQAGRR